MQCISIFVVEKGSFGCHLHFMQWPVTEVSSAFTSILLLRNWRVKIVPYGTLGWTFVLTLFGATGRLSECHESQWCIHFRLDFCFFNKCILWQRSNTAPPSLCTRHSRSDRPIPVYIIFFLQMSLDSSRTSSTAFLSWSWPLFRPLHFQVSFVNSIFPAAIVSLAF